MKLTIPQIKEQLSQRKQELQILDTTFQITIVGKVKQNNTTLLQGTNDVAITKNGKTGKAAAAWPEV